MYDTIYIVKKRKISSYIFAVLFALCRKPMQCGYYFSTGFLKQFRRTMKNECPDECVAHLLRMVPYLERMKVQKKSVVEMTDALSKTYSLSSGSKQMSPKKIVYALELGLIKKYEKHVMQTFPKVVLVSKADIEYLKERADVSGKNLYCHANGVSVGNFLHQSYDPNKICFVGNMRTLQNQDAVLYFVSEVFPIIKNANPNATFHIVGAESPEKIRSLADGKSIFVTGFVENLEAAISDSCIAVAPVRIAAGIQNKVLVAMGCGIPVVMTSLISKAIPELADRKNCLIRDSAESTAEICIQLMQDTEFRGRISLAGYETVRKCYSWNERLEGYEEIPGT